MDELTDNINNDCRRAPLLLQGTVTLSPLISARGSRIVLLFDDDRASTPSSELGPLALHRGSILHQDSVETDGSPAAARSSSLASSYLKQYKSGRESNFRVLANNNLGV